ncbi:CYTH domain-containing protein [Qiania dongpingensis]|uniref:CYTH domain-containing protein n=1 Tax=Qiania dongpingensis TaxID=2763669 RepID=A0A7G9G1P6_9FIRM|nr:CYTH domain-containing protein [Qiania dongpingensis]QNM04728.1 CYTH domain-containing protein [Qiania dongpingensis]
MEIERKFLVKKIPENLESYPCLTIEQAYLCTDPVVRIRQEDNSYYMTYKGKGMMAREEYNLPLNENAYLHLKAKADGRTITKKRYRIPLGTLTAELDIFSAPRELTLVEVEFSTEEEARSFCPPDWFGEDVTTDSRYHNSNMI